MALNYKAEVNHIRMRMPLTNVIVEKMKPEHQKRGKEPQVVDLRDMLNVLRLHKDATPCVLNRCPYSDMAFEAKAKTSVKHHSLEQCTGALGINLTFQP